VINSNAQIYRALISVGVEDGLARDAAASIGKYDRDIAKLKANIYMMQSAYVALLAAVLILLASSF
jgi:pyoverdine/dityrosine biosynthesis protein Dit1